MEAHRFFNGGVADLPFSSKIRYIKGGPIIEIGLSLGIYMVQLSGVPHLYYPHGILWVVTIVLISAALAPGLDITRGHSVSKSFRQMHRYVGRISIAPVAINIAPDLPMLPAIMAQ